MTVRRLAFGVVVASTVVAIAVSAQVPQFRTTVTGVGVPIVVRAGGDPVRGLTSSDFVLMDSGVVQDIIAVDAASLPLDLAVVAQENIWTTGGWATLEKETAAVAAATRPEDRVTVILAGNDQRAFAPPGPEHLAEKIQLVQTCSPVYDALVRVLMQPTPPDRQRVVVLITVDEGTGSFTSTELATEIARRSNARLYVVGMELILSRRKPFVGWGKCPEASVNWSADRQNRLRQIAAIPGVELGWNQLRVDSQNRLVDIAKLTGGREIHESLLRRQMSGPIREALDEARASYVLRYTPKGVPESGWHPITVKVTKPGRYDIRVRPGYER
jgi:VWFA-related protein